MPVSGTFVGLGDAPVVLSASASGLRLIAVQMSEDMLDNAALRNVANYTLTPNGGSAARTILSATPASDPDTILIVVDGDLSEGVAAYTITLANLLDLAGNALGTPDDADITVVAVDPIEVNSDGGEIVTFPVGLADGLYYVDIGTDPMVSAVRAYSGRSGMENDARSLDGVLEFAVPRVTPAEDYLALITPVGGGGTTLTGVLFHARRRPLFSATHSLRKALPEIRWSVGVSIPELEDVL